MKSIAESSAFVLAALWLGACASHNSHRIQVDLANDFDPLVDEAYAQLLQQWPAGEPGGTIWTSVAVEPVVVRWLPLSAEPALPFQQQEMARRVEARLWQIMGGPPDPSQPPEYVIEAELETDLHDPANIVYGISCSLARANDTGRELARGYSKLVQLQRLYCHGCNEALSGLGTRLVHPASDGAGYVGVGIWSGFYCPPSSHSSGYTKVR